MDLDALKANLKKDFKKIVSQEELNQFKVKYLGKKGQITELSKNIKNLSSKEKPTFGKKIGELRSLCEDFLGFAQEKIDLQIINEALEKDRIDVTLPGSYKSQGKLHPLTITTKKISDFFSSKGYLIEDGPEIESDYYNFDALNIPKDHPARDMHDTFYLDEQKKKLLRTHTSPVQIRTMLNGKPPFKIIVPGRTYRCDSDQTHAPMFHQLEGLHIDKNITMGHLKGCLNYFIREFFEVKKIKMRFRPSHFPFTEPSAEVDIGYKIENGKIVIGEGDKWLEILGCGMVHPNVLKNTKVDPKKYQGFAFGMGIDRLAMLKYGINDLRAFFETDYRWLNHFGFDPLDVPTNYRGLSR